MSMNTGFIMGIDNIPIVPQYLMSCYLYYELNSPVLTDSQFDDLSKVLLKNLNNLSHHHSKYIDKDDLVAGTGYSFNWKKMPKIIIGAALAWAKENDSLMKP